jgi:hypothetical protein
MSLRAEVPGRELVDQLVQVARSPWDPPSLDALTRRLGWAWSSEVDGYVAGPDFVVRPADPERTDGDPGGAFFVDFCVFMTDEDDPGGDQLADDWDGPGWPLTREAERDRFDAACLDAVQMVTAVLGEPERTGRDDDPDFPWLHALWPVDRGERVVIVVQRDDIDVELGSIWIRDTPPDDLRPARGEQFVDWLYR